MKCTYWLSLSVAITFVSSVASAQPRFTSTSPVDGSCAADVPTGATVEPATGRVTLQDGSSYTVPRCAVSWAPGRRMAFAGSGANEFGRKYGVTDSWAMAATAPAIPHEGEAAFDNIEQYLYVPDEPSIDYQAGVETTQSISCGLENVTPDGKWITIMQAEIVWEGTHQPGSTSGWVIQTQYLANQDTFAGADLYTSEAEPVNPGDKIFCEATEVQDNVWEILAVDQTAGGWSETRLVQPTTGLGATPYNLALLGLYEVPPEESCDVEMPPQGYDFVGSGQLLQAGPEWNSRFSVLNDVSVATFGEVGMFDELMGVNEGCDFSTSYIPSESLTMFQWYEVPGISGGVGGEEVLGRARADVPIFVRPPSLSLR